jgi:transcriptional/translational regulatory protein YebC/TACO1
MAVKAGGGTDPDKNRQLGQVIAEAKINNVPRDVITRNIEKGNAAATVDFKKSIFEFYGYGGVGLIVHVLTDNDNRAASDVALVAKKNALKGAATNSVNFKFDTKARLSLQTSIDEDSLMELCLENGIDDYELRSVVDGNPLSPQEEGQVHNRIIHMILCILVENALLHYLFCIPVIISSSDHSLYIL